MTEITTPEEQDALPEGSVVRLGSGQVLHVYVYDSPRLTWRERLTGRRYDPSRFAVVTPAGDPPLPGMDVSCVAILLTEEATR